MIRPLGVYVHFPWCVRKCPYCDFNSHPLRDDSDRDAYVDALAADWRAQVANLDVEPGDVGSVFLGGGTPSLFTPAQIDRVLTLVGELTAGDAEVTMEANPGTTEHAEWGGYLAAGVNRLSLGAQSFAGDQLTTLGRIHGPDEIVVAIKSAREAGFTNINIDLMHGLPRQTVAAAMFDLERAIELAPEHISWYQLTLEPKTEFGRRPPTLPDDDVLADIENEGLRKLAAAGFERYEVSAFARPGFSSRHNKTYWTFGDYVGVGAGAHGKQTDRSGVIVRTRKAGSPRLYQNAPTAIERDPVEPGDVVGEFMMNALRLVDGTPVRVFEACTGLPFSQIDAAWRKGVADGLLRPVDATRQNAAALAATPFGYRHLDSVIARFL